MKGLAINIIKILLQLFCCLKIKVRQLFPSVPIKLAGWHCSYCMAILIRVTSLEQLSVAEFSGE